MKINKLAIKNVLQKKHTTPIYIFGDIMLDRYYSGDVSRISQEAPIPIIAVKDEYDKLGGAGNAADNLISIGQPVEIISVLGDDHSGDRIKHLCNDSNIKYNFIVEKGRKSSIKVRFSSLHQQMLRADFETTTYISNKVSREIISYFQQIPAKSTIIVSDYNKGVCKPNIIKTLIEMKQEKKFKIIIDPKPKHKISYKFCDYITPNRKEFETMMNCTITESNIKKICKQFVHRFRTDNLILTLGDKGLLYYNSKNYCIRVPAYTRNVYDVSGCGDTVIALIAFGISNSLSISNTLFLANLAAGIVVQKVGTATCTVDEILKQL